ncbi:MAG: hypothetical protein J0H92_13610 [Sphingobacteriales bacterium]|mgnify:CR=1 FL=1|nr:hypothetical protein [Sphingobacteriales bacterium]OJW36649.1 MAG: hypothetical protein BGO54_12530 [Sphingobacteriales bacterium 46-32]
MSPGFSGNKNYRLLYGLHFPALLIALVQFIPAGYSVALSLVKPAQREGLELKVSVVNSSADNVRILKHRQTDYKRENIKALGNYIVELRQLKGDKFILFTPTADIDPIFEEEEYILFKKGEHLCDTLYVAGALFSDGNSSARGFPPGQYRVRVYFNPDRGYSSEINSSEWIDFTVK